ncbi:hypothetical protein [Chamaesiphon minutus]|nr:hypothetical protein [Chamaesiphon minutus]
MPDILSFGSGIESKFGVQILAGRISSAQWRELHKTLLQVNDSYSQ